MLFKMARLFICSVTVKTFVWSVCFIPKIIIKIILEKLVFWNGLNKTEVSYEDWLLQGNVGDRSTALAGPTLHRLPLLPHLPQLRVLKVGSHVSLPMA